MLQEICDNSGEAAVLAQELLLVEEEQAGYEVVERNHDSDLSTSDEKEQSDEGSEVEDEDEEEDAEDDEAKDTDGHRAGVSADAASSLKRLRPRFATCVNCSEEFDVTANNKRSCVWHPSRGPASLHLRPVTNTE